MTGLPSNIIKKYGVSKKAWSVFRSGKRGGSTMARKKRSKGSFFRRGKGGDSGVSLMNTAAPAALYGAVREPIANALTPLTSKIPLGDVSDEIVLGTLAYFGAKKTSGFMRNLCRSALVVESARIGESVRKGTAFTGTGDQSSLFSGR